jgi:tetratricopeptide (TPR) repeat protein
VGALLLSSLLYAQDDVSLGDVARQSRAASAELRKANPNVRRTVWEDGAGGGEESASTGADAGDKSATHDPNSAEGIVDRGLALDRQRRFDEALAEYDRALALRPDYGRAYYDIAVVKGEKGDEAGAIEAYKKAIALNYPKAYAYKNLAITLNERGRYSETEELLRKGLVQFPNDCCLMLHFGRSLAAQGKFEEAIVSYREILRIHPEQKAARRELCDVLMKLGRRDEAEMVRASNNLQR